MKGNGPMGLSIVGGIDQACPPFGIEQRGVFVSKVKKNKQRVFRKKIVIVCIDRFFRMDQHLEQIFVLVIEY